VALLDPDLVTIELGVNDYLRGTASPAELKANLQRQIGNLRDGSAGRSPSIVLVITYGIGVVPSPPTYRWDDYADELRSIAKGDPTVGVLDLTAMGTSKPGGLWAADALHPSDRGNAEMARRAAAYLTPP
jgi:lysophospholipase L1-like esterase